MYIGAALGSPFRRLAQHNGERSGGTARLAGARPWTVIAWVSGFPTWKHALKFEHAWQRGYAAACMRHAPPPTEGTRGVLGKLRILRALLHTQAWYWHGLHVHLVTGARRSVCVRRSAALGGPGRVHLTWCDPPLAA